MQHWHWNLSLVKYMHVYNLLTFIMALKEVANFFRVWLPNSRKKWPNFQKMVYYFWRKFGGKKKKIGLPIFGTGGPISKNDFFFYAKKITKSKFIYFIYFWNFCDFWKLGHQSRKMIRRFYFNLFIIWS